MKRFLIILLSFILCLTSCSQDSSQESSNTDEYNFSLNDDEMFTKRDKDDSYDESEAIAINLSDDNSQASDDSVLIDGNQITITKEATYVIKGNLSDGMIMVDCNDGKVQLVLNDVDITSKNSAALYIKEANKVFITSPQNTSNKLSNIDSFNTIDDNNIDATIFSKCDITFNGSGSINVSSTNGHGITCKDDLVITNGNYTIEALNHGLDANNSIRISDQTNLDINASKDGLHCEDEDESKGFIYISNATMKINSVGDALSASSYLVVKEGDYNLTSGGGSENASVKEDDFMHHDFFNEESNEDSISSKALKCGTTLLILNGSFNINSCDDALHSNQDVFIEGGSFEIASGDDGIHANETLKFNDGDLNITTSYEGLEACDLFINGGNLNIIASDDGLNAASSSTMNFEQNDSFTNISDNEDKPMMNPENMPQKPDGEAMDKPEDMGDKEPMDKPENMGDRESMEKPDGINDRDPQGMPMPNDDENNEKFDHGKQPMGGFGGMNENSNCTITISGGNIYIQANGDGIDANGTLEITGGNIVVCGPTFGDTSTLDYDKTATISGGSFIGTGASNMAQSFSDATQGVIALQVGNQAANTTITLYDQDGNELLSHTPLLDYQIVIISNASLKANETYRIQVGNINKEIQAN